VLAKLGIITLDDIAACDPVQTRAALRAHHGHAVTENVIRGWQAHVQSYEVNAPIVFGDRSIDYSDFMAFDLEYVPGEDGLIWLIGMAVVKNGSTTLKQLWGDDSAEIRRNLQTLAATIAENPGLPVVTWSGLSAEIPQLEAAVEHHNLGGDLHELFHRHMDLYAYADANIRLPIPGLDLKSVGRYFGFYRDADVRNGLEADHLYAIYQNSECTQEKAEVKRVLLDYNREDVEALIHIVQRFRQFAP
jgi:predicted RecB family nuclease